MDFELEYGAEARAFRQEVREWLEANLPSESLSRDHRKHMPEDYRRGRAFQRKLGAKGWRVPWAPREYGGAALPIEKCLILSEELRTADHRVARPEDNGPGNIIGTVLTYGTEEQKQTWARSIVEGTAFWGQGLTEPEAGSDLANVQSRALRDGDQWVINGVKIFQHAGHGFGPAYGSDMYYILAVSNPDRPRHHNLSVFCFSMDLPGITITPMRLITGDRGAIYFDNVHLPSSALLGPEGQGWQVNQALLEIEHGFEQGVHPDEVVPMVLQFMKEGPQDGAPMVQDGVKRDRYLDNYIGAHVGYLFQLRGYYERMNKEIGPYTGSQTILHEKVFGVQQADRNLEIAGLYALMDDEHEAPMKGYIEEHFREALTAVHPSGTIEVHKIIIARRVGMSATRERAAATT
ncbi:MAG: acyl-CoA dehydrogenase family protein [Chloroflexi bacterium]|nr:acyl-CoA dehydrogenase family protein [Chloroflexota bacterium]